MHIILLLVKRYESLLNVTVLQFLHTYHANQSISEVKQLVAVKPWMDDGFFEHIDTPLCIRNHIKFSYDNWDHFAFLIRPMTVVTEILTKGWVIAEFACKDIAAHRLAHHLENVFEFLIFPFTAVTAIHNVFLY